MKEVIKNNAFLYACTLSLLLMIITILTLDWYPLTWTDEVMWTDPAINVVQFGIWTSTIWDYGRSPLYTFLLVPWIYIFGISHTAICSLNTIFAFLISVLILYSMVKLQLLKSVASSLMFILIFWCAASFSWTIRNGRIDMLLLLLTLLIVKEILYFKTTKKSIGLIFTYSIVLFWSGIYTPPLIVFFFLFLFITYKEKRQVIKSQLVAFLSGSFIGLIGVSLFYFSHQQMLHFWFTFIDSSSRSNLFFSILNAYFVRNPYLDTKEVLLLLLITAFTTIIYRKQIRKDKLLFLCIIFAIMVPMLMSIIGRYRVYYSWLCFVPLLICFIILVERFPSRLNKLSAYILTFLIVISGLPWKLYESDKTAMNRVESLIKKQNFKEGDDIISGYLPYYALKNARCNMYLGLERTGAPTFKKLTNNIKEETLRSKITEILLKYEKWGNETTVSDNYDYYIFVDHDWEYDKNEIKKRVYTYLKQTDSRLELMDKLDYPSIEIYKIIKNQ